jgi:hypothetical protein
MDWTSVDLVCWRFKVIGLPVWRAAVTKAVVATMNNHSLPVCSSAAAHAQGCYQPTRPTLDAGCDGQHHPLASKAQISALGEAHTSVIAIAGSFYCDRAKIFLMRVIRARKGRDAGRQEATPGPSLRLLSESDQRCS